MSSLFRLRSRAVSSFSAAWSGFSELRPTPFVPSFSPQVLKRQALQRRVAVYAAVEGRPADCVKLALLELLPSQPDVVISGMNAGSNAGINVLYSGTVAAAIEGAFYRRTAIAVSLEFALQRFGIGLASLQAVAGGNAVAKTHQHRRGRGQSRNRKEQHPKRND